MTILIVLGRYFWSDTGDASVDKRSTATNKKRNNKDKQGARRKHNLLLIIKQHSIENK
jgi:hypothetical protein